MKDLKAQKGKFYIARLIQQGEHVTQDFKFSISDARKIARSISAFANTQGGRLLIGVKDNGVVAGIRNEEDIFVVEEAAELYCRPEQHVDFHAYNVGNGVKVVVAEIEASPRRPVEVREEKEWRAYQRVKDENIVAHPLTVEAWKDSPVPVTLSDAAKAVLAAVQTAGKPLLPQQIAVAARLSLVTTETALVSLLRLKLVVFIYKNNGWYITIPENME